MALATKCPHCNTVFRVAHDQLKLRGGIVRCGACNEVFDGNAALVEPPVRPPVTPPAEPVPAAEQALELQAEQVEAALADPAPPADDTELPLDQEIDFDLDLNVDEEAPAAPAPITAAPAVPAREDAIAAAAAPDAAERREPSFDTPQEHLVAVALDELHHFDAGETHSAAPATPPWADASPAASGAGDEKAEAEALDAARSVIAGGASPAAAALRASRLTPAGRGAQDTGRSRDADDGDAGVSASADSDENARTEAHAAGAAIDSGTEAPIAAAEARRAEAPVRSEAAASAAVPDRSAAAFSLAPPVAVPADADADNASPHEEPDFIKRDRRRQQLGKAARVAMACALPLLLGGLLLQGLTTFRNSLAASVPELKPALVALCASVGCKVDYPTQIDALSVEQGELQAMTDLTFSYATVLRNQSRTAQAWPHLELILNDSADKPVLRRVFAPRDYLASPAEVEKGFSPRSEQTVKLYFELRQLKASGYHIAIFYP